MNKQAKLKKQLGIGALFILCLVLTLVLAAEGDYLSIEWNTADTGELRGIDTNDTWLYAAALNLDLVIQYSARDGAHEVNWSTAGEMAAPWGVTTNGTWIWVLSRGDDAIYRYNMSGSYMSETWSITGNNDDATDITTNGSQFWVCDIADEEVYTYNMSGYQTGNWDIGSEGNDDCTGITHDGARSIWTIDEVDEDLRRWNANNGAYISGYDTSGDTVASYGVAANDSWVYVSAITSESFFIYEGANTGAPVDYAYINVAACGTTLNESHTNYSLSADIETNTGTCITITNHSIIFNLNSYEVGFNNLTTSYSDCGSGIRIGDNINHTIIKNGEVTQLDNCNAGTTYTYNHPIKIGENVQGTIINNTNLTSTDDVIYSLNNVIGFDTGVDPYNITIANSKLHEVDSSNLGLSGYNIKYTNIEIGDTVSIYNSYNIEYDGLYGSALKNSRSTINNISFNNITDMSFEFFLVHNLTITNASEVSLKLTTFQNTSFSIEGNNFTTLTIADGNDEVILKNNIITSAVDFRTSPGSSVIFLNITYEGTVTETIDPTNEMTRKWYFQPQANYSNGTAVNQGNFSSMITSGSIVESELTGTDGSTSLWELSEYINIGGTSTYYNNTINLTKTDWDTNSTLFFINYSSYFTQFFLSETTAPVITITYPADGITTEDYLIDINYTISDVGGVESCWYNNETGTLNVTLTCGTTNVTSLNWPEGQHNVTIWGNDTSNNIGSNTTTFTIKRLNVTLSDPEHAATITTTGYNFTSNYTTTIDSNFTNVTYFMWYSNTTLFNETTRNINGTINSTTLNIEGLETGGYYWNTLACAETTDEHFCYTEDINYTLLVGLVFGTTKYNEVAYETDIELFSTNFTIASGSSLVSANLIYNNTFYPVSNISIVGGTNYTLSREIDIPLNADYFGNETNNILWSFTFVNEAETQSYQNSSIETQNVTFIILNECNATYPTTLNHALNFTMYDEITTLPIDPTANATTLKSTFDYWLGDGSVKKEYAYQNLSSPVFGEFNFCIFPTNKTLSTDMNTEYTAVGYSTRKYYLNGAPLDNSSNNIRLELLADDDSVKFFISVIQGATSFPDATITISKYFTGEGGYRVTEIRESDVNGEFVAYLDLDQTYKFLIVKNGTSYGTITQQAICTEAPCEMTLLIEEAIVDMWQGYYDVFATDVSYSLTYNDTTNIVTYSFSDLTGLAQYFQLDVYETKLDVSSTLAFEPDGTWCNKTLAAVSGTLLCDLSNYTINNQSANFIASGYISRSPLRLVKSIHIAISNLHDVLGLLGVFVSFIIIMVVGLAGVWNPAVGVALTALAVLIMGVVGFTAFSATTIILVVILAGIIIFKMKS